MSVDEEEVVSIQWRALTRIEPLRKCVEIRRGESVKERCEGAAIKQKLVTTRSGGSLSSAKQI